MPDLDSPAAPVSAPLSRRLGLVQATALNMIDMVGIGPFVTLPLVMVQRWLLKSANKYVAIKGKGAMPPKGGSAASDADIHAAVVYMVNAAK